MKDWEQGDAIANGVRLHYYRTGGDKPPLVLAHGITDNGLCWTRLARALEPEYDVVMYDARGHGRSDAPEDGYSYDDHAADLAGLVTVLGLRQPRLMGHSMGAASVAVMAARHPELVHCVVLEDPPWRPDFVASTPEQQQAAAEQWRVMLAGWQAKTRAELVAWCRQERAHWDEADIGPWADSKLQAHMNVVKVVSAPRTPWQEVVSRIQCPILLLRGDPVLGAIVSPESAREAASLWRRGQVVHIPGAGHNIRRDQFERTLAAIRSFLCACQDDQVGQPRSD